MRTVSPFMETDNLKVVHSDCIPPCHTEIKLTQKTFTFNRNFEEWYYRK
jgi:hypothetical protein